MKVWPMEVELFGDERLDMLYRDEVRIIQSKEVFSFSIDAVLLANFANPHNGGKGTIVDLGTGNGAIPLFMAHKVTGHIIGIEIQPRLADMARRSIALNDLDDKITVINKDMKDIFTDIFPGSVETVVSNPPYFAATVQSHKNPNEHYAIARHEIKADLKLVSYTAKKLLKSGGHFYMVHRPDRLFEILDALRAENLIPKRIQFVYPKVGKEANMVLIESIKNGRLTGAQILPPVIVHNADGTYRDEVWAIYEGRNHDW